ncbi:hypothetical protein [Spartinivicinus poritis]|uniref:Uncharacterized protein n=1 Tax=Spartinivicinus poritis TaxID=2994640 RepID=A0ABT5UEV9_9GAMM|nr:hypothetical protein [Spartinivicinus sp. A2-2]MDE1464008.1 hypothetical protein [Spartinivicinus sp. A2-2]
MKRWLGMLLLLVTFHTQSALLTVEEERSKAAIYEKYDTASILIEINEIQNRRRNLQLEKKEKTRRLSESKEQYKQKIQELEVALLRSKRAEITNEVLSSSESSPQVLFQDLEDLATNISRLELNGASTNEQLTQLTAKLDGLKRSFKRTRSQKDSQLLALRELILERYTKEVSTVKTMDYKGSFRCGTRVSIHDCMGLVPLEKMVLVKAKKSLPVAKVAILEHSYISFSLDLNGNAKFAVNVRFTGTFSADINEQINQALGINAFEVVILSNRDDAEHFVNGDYIGKGKRVSITVSAGQNAFYSLAENKKESVVEMITDNQKLTFNF